MDVIVSARFAKDVDKLPDKNFRNKLAIIIVDLQQCKLLSQIKNCKKLKGFKNAYRIKVGDYRLGFLYVNEKIYLGRVMHRKEIYRYFPET